MAWLLSEADIGYAVIIWSYSLEYGGIEAVLDEFVPRTLGSRIGAGALICAARHPSRCGRPAFRD